jgi:Arc/MetJ-type ribon-helix-helix transcriptional regulator
MSIDLKPEQQRVIDLAVRSGAYRNSDEVLDWAFEIIREQLGLEDWMFERREAIAAHIETGFAQAARGELIDGDAALETLRKRRAERLNTAFQFTPQATDLVELFAPVRGLFADGELDCSRHP